MPAGVPSRMGSTARASGRNWETHEMDPTATFEVHGSQRKTRLAQMFWVSLVIVALSAAAIVVGSLAMLESSEFPFIMNSPGLAGLACLLSASLTLCLVQTGRKAATHEELPSGYKSIFCCGLVTLIFSWLFLVLAVGLGGIWATMECVGNIRRRSDEHLSLCKGDAHKLFALSLAALVLMCLLAILLLILHLLYCFNQSGMQADQEVGKYEHHSLLDTETEHSDMPKRLKDYKGGPKNLRIYQDTHAPEKEESRQNHDRSHQGYDLFDKYDPRLDDSFEQSRRYMHKDNFKYNEHEKEKYFDHNHEEPYRHGRSRSHDHFDRFTGHQTSHSHRFTSRKGQGRSFHREHRSDHDRRSHNRSASYSASDNERYNRQFYSHDDKYSNSTSRNTQSTNDKHKLRQGPRTSDYRRSADYESRARGSSKGNESSHGHMSSRRRATHTVV